MAGRAATDKVIRGRFAISVNDPGHSLPPGWIRVLLSDIAELGTGHTPSRQHLEYWDGDVPWIGIRDAGAHHGGVINVTNQYITNLGLENSAAVLLPKDTICLSRTASVGYVVKMGRRMATSQDFVNWTCSAGLCPDYLMNALLAEGDEIRRFGEGSTHTTIYFPQVKAFHIDLPPLAEQKRIVAKLDALSAKSVRARTELARIETLVSRYKQAVLDAAFNTANGTVPLESLVDGFRGIPYGIVKTGDPYPSGVPTIRCGDIKAYRVEKKNLKLVDPKIAELYKRTSLRGGEVLIAIRGSIGETCVVGSELSGANISREVAMIPVSKALNPQFAMYFLKSKAAIEFIGINTKGSAQRGINLGDLRKLPIPTVPIQSQNEIVRRIETAFARIDRLAAEAKRALTLVGKLDEAILAKAFRGELVPQDESDEPASDLLDRIRAERAAAPKPERGRARA